MRNEYDFSDGQRGRFHRPGTVLVPPAGGEPGVAMPGSGTSGAGIDTLPLLADVIYLAARAQADADPQQRAIHARAAIVIGMASIEAVTNDALGAMHALIAAPVPAGRGDEPPWRHFSGRSAKYISKMLDRNKHASRSEHVLAQIKRIDKTTLPPDLVREIERLRSARNRILHMRRRHLPHRHDVLMDAAEAARLAVLAEACARRYAEFVGGAFARFGLPLGGATDESGKPSAK